MFTAWPDIYILCSEAHYLAVTIYCHHSGGPRTSASQICVLVPSVWRLCLDRVGHKVNQRWGSRKEGSVHIL